MTKLLVCVDGSSYADNVCQAAAWVSGRLNADVKLLHVLRRHSDYSAPSDDHTGAIGISARSHLLEELAKVDEERGRLDQKKGEIILEHSEDVLKEAGVKEIETIHRRGALVETIKSYEDDVDMIFMGKRGEHANVDSPYLGSNLEKSVRAVHKPVFLVSSIARPIEKILIAYDGKDGANKAIDYICESPLFKGLECHLLKVQAREGDVSSADAEKRLEEAGFSVTATSELSDHPDEAIGKYVTDNNIDLLITGAYGHSRIRSMLLGSTTASLIKSCKIPMLLFR